MNVLIVAEKEGTAIHRLAMYTKVANQHHNIRVLCVHPKRPNAEQLKAFHEAYEWCDVVDYRYWKTAENLVAQVGSSKPSLLTHYNPYDLRERAWAHYKRSVVVNQYQKSVLKSAEIIPLAVDLNFWKMQPEFAKERLNVVCMVANRIEGKKGILQVAQATSELGMTLLLVGRPSKPEYLKEVLKFKNVQFYEGISDEELRAIYYKSGIHVCNSIDNFESGTMPILEAMACGVPVLSRLVGHVPDIWDGTNMEVHKADPTNVEAIKERLLFMREHYDVMGKMRQKAWHTIKYRNIEITGRQYSKLYSALLHSPNELVSIILPTCDRTEQLKRGLISLVTQSVHQFEIVVVDDSSDVKTQIANLAIVEAIKETTSVTIKYATSDRYYYNGVKRYGLATARNRGIVEAEGQWLMFVDDRFEIASNTLENFYEKRNPRTWQFGIKDGNKKGFVENLSFIQRDACIRMGMFNEQLETYGGMTQDASNRARLNQIKLQPNEQATATSQIKSNNRLRKFDQIVQSKTLCYKLYQG